MKRANTKLLCSECLNRNYSFYKGENSNKKITLNKYCKTCNKYTEHKETR